MWKEVPTERWIAEVTTAGDTIQPLGINIFGERKDAEKWGQELIEMRERDNSPVRVFLRKWEGIELVYVENEN